MSGQTFFSFIIVFLYKVIISSRFSEILGSQKVSQLDTVFSNIVNCISFPLFLH